MLHTLRWDASSVHKLTVQTKTEQQQKPTKFSNSKCDLRTCGVRLPATLGRSDFHGRLVKVERLVCRVQVCPSLQLEQALTHRTTSNIEALANALG